VRKSLYDRVPSIGLTGDVTAGRCAARALVYCVVVCVAMVHYTAGVWMIQKERLKEVCCRSILRSLLRSGRRMPERDVEILEQSGFGWLR
jgi:hypothetical protein